MDFEFVSGAGGGAPAPESGVVPAAAAVLKRSSAVLEVLGTLPLSLSVVTRNTVSLS